jgi:hypothetical protein
MQCSLPRLYTNMMAAGTYVDGGVDEANDNEHVLEDV